MNIGNDEDAHTSDLTVATRQGQKYVHHIMLWIDMRVKGGQYSLVKSYIFSLTAAVMLLAGCISPAPAATMTPVSDAPADSTTQAIPVGPILTSTPAAPPMPTTSPYPWTDESAVMSGLCFESVDDAAGQTFILTSLEDL